MDENTKLILDLTRNVPTPPHEGWEPMNYDVDSLLAEARKRVNTDKSEKLPDVDEAANSRVRRAS